MELEHQILKRTTQMTGELQYLLCTATLNLCYILLGLDPTIYESNHNSHPKTHGFEEIMATSCPRHILVTSSQLLVSTKADLLNQFQNDKSMLL